MSSTPSTYQRLAQSGRSSVLLAADHIVYIIGSGFFFESYRRFYFRDIQAFIVQRTAGRGIGNTLLGIALALCLAGLATGGIAMQFFCGSMGTVFAIALLVNSLKGPTCRFRVVTRVSDTRIAPLNRLRKAEAFLARIEPLVREAQPPMDPAALAEQVRSSEPQSLPGRQWNSPRELRPVSTRLHLATAMGFGVYAAIETFGIAMHTSAVSMVSLLAFLALIFLTIGALARQQGSTLATPLKTWSWIAISYLCVLYVVGYSFSMSQMFLNPLAMTSQWQIYRSLLGLSPTSSTSLFVISIMSALGLALLCCFGAMLIRREPRPIPATETPSPPTPDLQA